MARTRERNSRRASARTPARRPATSARAFATSTAGLPTSNNITPATTAASPTRSTRSGNFGRRTGPGGAKATGRLGMNFGGTTFVLAIIALSIGGWMFTTWIRAKHGYPVENEWGGTVHRTDPDADRKIALLTDDNAKLAGIGNPV